MGWHKSFALAIKHICATIWEERPVQGCAPASGDWHKPHLASGRERLCECPISFLPWNASSLPSHLFPQLSSTQLSAWTTKQWRTGTAHYLQWSLDGGIHRHALWHVFNTQPAPHRVLRPFCGCFWPHFMTHEQAVLDSGDGHADSMVSLSTCRHSVGITH